MAKQVDMFCAVNLNSLITRPEILMATSNNEAIMICSFHNRVSDDDHWMPCEYTEIFINELPHEPVILDGLVLCNNTSWENFKGVNSNETV